MKNNKWPVFTFKGPYTLWNPNYTRVILYSFSICSVKYKHNEIFKTAGRVSLQPSIILHYFYTAILGRQLVMGFTISHRWSFQLGWSEIETRIYTSNFKRHNSKALIKDIVIYFFLQVLTICTCRTKGRNRTLRLLTGHSGENKRYSDGKRLLLSQYYLIFLLWLDRVKRKYISFYEKNTCNNFEVLRWAEVTLNDGLYCTFQCQRGNRTWAHSVVLPANAN